MKTQTDKLMKTMMNKQELHDLFVQGNAKVADLISQESNLIENLGFYHTLILRGGFVIPPQCVSWEAFDDAWKRLTPSLPSPLAAHYYHLVVQFIRLLNRGLDASRVKEVKIQLLLDSQASLLDWKGLRYPDFIVRHEHLTLAVEDYAFYNLVVMVKSPRREKVVYSLHGIPHFYLQAVIYLLGMWVAQSQEAPEHAPVEA